jgi:hypothetical protein
MLGAWLWGTKPASKVGGLEFNHQYFKNKQASKQIPKQSKTHHSKKHSSATEEITFY